MLHREVQTILRFLENCSSSNSCWSSHIAARTCAKETQQRRRDLRDRWHEVERSETPREKARSTRVLSLAPQNTPHTPRSTATRTPPHAHRKMQTKKTLAARGAHGLVRDIPWHSGRAFGTWDMLWHLGFYFYFKCKHYFLNLYLYKMII